MEVILSTAFGRSLDVQGGKGGKLFESAVTVFKAVSPPQKGDPPNFFRLLQFISGKLYLLISTCFKSYQVGMHNSRICGIESFAAVIGTC